MSGAPLPVAGLWDRLHGVREALLALRLTAVEDRPAEGGTLAAERLADELEAACAEMQAAVDALDRLRGCSAARPAEALADAHRHLQTAANLYWLAFGPRRSQRELHRIARTGGEQWAAWVQALWSAAENVTAELGEALDALPDAWLAIACPAPAIQVHTTAVGQQLLAATSPQTKETP